MTSLTLSRDILVTILTTYLDGETLYKLATIIDLAHSIIEKQLTNIVENNLKKTPGINFDRIKSALIASDGILLGSQILNACYSDVDAVDWDFCVQAKNFDERSNKYKFSPLECYLWKQSIISCPHCLPMFEDKIPALRINDYDNDVKLSGCLDDITITREMKHIHKYTNAAQLKDGKDNHYSCVEPLQLNDNIPSDDKEPNSAYIDLTHLGILKIRTYVIKSTKFQVITVSSSPIKFSKVAPDFTFLRGNYYNGEKTVIANEKLIIDKIADSRNYKYAHDSQANFRQHKYELKGFIVKR